MKTCVSFLLLKIILCCSSVSAAGVADTTIFSLKNLHNPPELTYSHDELHIFSWQNELHFDTIKRKGNYYFEVRTEWISGDSMKCWGLVFGARKPEDYYLFRICKQPGKRNGSFGLQKISISQNNKTIHNYIALTPDTSLHPEINYLKVALRGDSVFLYINNHLVGFLRDKKAKNGGIGIYADAGVHVHFSDLKIEQNEFITKLQLIRNADTTYDLPSDSFTKVNYNFSDFQPNWPNKSDSYFERGYYRIYSFENRWHAYLRKIDNFSLYLNIRIHRWDSTGYMSIHFHCDDVSDYVPYRAIQIGKDHFFTYYSRYNKDKPEIAHHMPFDIDSGGVLQLLLESQDTDVKLTVNGVERVLIMDEQGMQEEQIDGYIRLNFYQMELDLLSLKLNGRPIDEYGLKATMPTCVVFRLANPTTGDKPLIMTIPTRHPIEKFLDDVSDFFDDWLNEWEGWFFVFWGGLLILTSIFVDRLRRKRYRIKNFEKDFLLLMRLANGSVWLKNLRPFFYPLKEKKLLSLIFRHQDKLSLQIKTVDAQKGMLIEMPVFMNTLPADFETAVLHIKRNYSDLDIREIRKDLLTLIQMADVYGGRLSIDYLKKECTENPKCLELYYRYVHELKYPFETLAKDLFGILAEREGVQLVQHDLIFDFQLIHSVNHLK